jgi:hypothetical protein
MGKGMTFVDLRARAAYVGLLILLFLAAYMIVGDGPSFEQGTVLIVGV